MERVHHSNHPQSFKRSSSTHPHFSSTPSQPISVSTPFIPHSSRLPPHDRSYGEYGTSHQGPSYRPPPTSHYATIRAPPQSQVKGSSRTMAPYYRDHNDAPSGAKRPATGAPTSHSNRLTQSQRDPQRSSQMRQKSAPAVHHMSTTVPLSRSTTRDPVVKPLQPYRSSGIPVVRHFPSYHSVTGAAEMHSRQRRSLSGDGSSIASSGTNLSIAANPPQRSYYTTIGGRVFHRTISFPQNNVDHPTISSKQAQFGSSFSAFSADLERSHYMRPSRDRGAYQSGRNTLPGLREGIISHTTTSSPVDPFSSIADSGGPPFSQRPQQRKRTGSLLTNAFNAAVESIASGMDNMRKGRRDSNDMAACIVTMLDGREQTFLVPKTAKGSLLFEKVCQSMELLETEYFGLRYTGSNNIWYWLSLKKRIRKYFATQPWEFEFQTKFYPPQPYHLKESLTRYLLCLQIRQDMVCKTLPCSFQTFVTLGAYVAQSEMGDYNALHHGTGIDYLLEMRFGPEHLETQELLERISELHKLLKGIPPEAADLRFLENAKKLALYGVDFHKTKDTDLMIGVYHSGILIYSGRLRVSRFFWSKIVKISYMRSAFRMYLRKTDHGQSGKLIEFQCQNSAMAKRLWKTCVEHHAFFRLRNQDDTTSKRATLLPPGTARFSRSPVMDESSIHNIHDNFDFQPLPFSSYEDHPQVHTKHAYPMNAADTEMLPNMSSSRVLNHEDYWYGVTGTTHHRVQAPGPSTHSAACQTNGSQSYNRDHLVNGGDNCTLVSLTPTPTTRVAHKVAHRAPPSTTSVACDEEHSSLAVDGFIDSLNDEAAHTAVVTDRKSNLDEALLKGPSQNLRPFPTTLNGNGPEFQAAAATTSPPGPSSDNCLHSQYNHLVQPPSNQPLRNVSPSRLDTKEQHNDIRRQSSEWNQSTVTSRSARPILEHYMDPTIRIPKPKSQPQLESHARRSSANSHLGLANHLPSQSSDNLRGGAAHPTPAVDTFVYHPHFPSVVPPLSSINLAEEGSFRTKTPETRSMSRSRLLPAPKWRMSVLDISPGLTLEPLRGLAVGPSTSVALSPEGGGARCSWGVSDYGKYFFEVIITGQQAKSAVRVGWATQKASLLLGEDRGGFAFGAPSLRLSERGEQGATDRDSGISVGASSSGAAPPCSLSSQVKSRWKNNICSVKMAGGEAVPLGDPLVSGDAVGCYLDFHRGAIFWSCNGRLLDEGLGLPIPALYRREAFFPTVALNNCSLLLNFGDSPFVYPPPAEGNWVPVCRAPRHLMVSNIWQGWRLNPYDVTKSSDTQLGIELSADAMVAQTRTATWQGVRSNRALIKSEEDSSLLRLVINGVFYYEVSLLELGQGVQGDDVENGVMAGWSTGEAALCVAEDELSIAFGTLPLDKHPVMKSPAVGFVQGTRLTVMNGGRGMRLNSGDVIGCLLDLDNGWAEWTYNGNTVKPMSGRDSSFISLPRAYHNEPYFPTIFMKNATVACNFGSTPYKFDPPVKTSWQPVSSAYKSNVYASSKQGPKKTTVTLWTPENEELLKRILSTRSKSVVATPANKSQTSDVGVTFALSSSTTSSTSNDKITKEMSTLDVTQTTPLTVECSPPSTTLGGELHAEPCNVYSGHYHMVHPETTDTTVSYTPEGHQITRSVKRTTQYSSGFSSLNTTNTSSEMMADNKLVNSQPLEQQASNDTTTLNDTSKERHRAASQSTLPAGYIHPSHPPHHSIHVAPSAQVNYCGKGIPTMLTKTAFYCYHPTNAVTEQRTPNPVHHPYTEIMKTSASGSTHQLNLCNCGHASSQVSLIAHSHPSSHLHSLPLSKAAVFHPPH